MVDTARAVAALYGYREMATPVFEFTELFARGIGETSDVVSKEMYTFEDRGGEIAHPAARIHRRHLPRLHLHGELAQQLPLKLFAVGPMFRYERPQKGRQRQFHQIDVEVLGAPEPGADIEVITLAADVLDRWASSGAACSSSILWATRPAAPPIARCWSTITARTSTGCRWPTRRRACSATRCASSSSKDDADKAINAKAPSLADYLNQASRDFFGAVREGLAAAGVSFEIDPGLVRGLDYYTHTAFEFVTTHIGAQGTVLGGGRYDGLIAELGGPPAAGIGWAGGIERLMLLCNDPPPLARPVVLVPLGWAAESKALGIGRVLRSAGITVEQDYRGNMKRRMQRANKLNARAAVILGDEELAKGVVQLKDLDSGQQREVATDALAAALKS